MRWLSVARRRLEGIDYRAHARGFSHPAAYARLRRREGLGPWRQAWWRYTQLEPYRTVRRYALLLDWALAQQADQKPSTSAERLPPNARLVALRMGHLGDILHLMPTLREIKRQRPDVHVELVTGPWNRELLESDPILSAVHYYTPDIVQYHRGQTHSACSRREEQSFIERVRAGGVDVMFCPMRPHFAELPLIVGLQPRVYVGGDWAWPDVPVDFPQYTRPFDSRHYEMNAVADHLPLLGLNRVDVQLRMDVPTSCRDRLKERLKETQAPRVALFPGSGWPGKNWSPQGFASVADHLVESHRASIILAGAPHERDLCDQVARLMRNPSLNVAGTMSILESAALIEQSALVLGNDSAPIHIAAALNVSTVSLWGPTFPEKWAPPGAIHRAVHAPGPCAGCLYWHPRSACHGHPPCMETLSVESVIQAVEKLWQTQVSGAHNEHN